MTSRLLGCRTPQVDKICRDIHYLELTGISLQLQSFLVVLETFLSMPQGSDGCSKILLTEGFRNLFSCSNSPVSVLRANTSDMKLFKKSGDGYTGKSVHWASFLAVKNNNCFLDLFDLRPETSERFWTKLLWNNLRSAPLLLPSSNIKSTLLHCLKLVCRTKEDL
ncbi:hypothetical protein HELRODRAFT_164339 [Helobdella robusta]|uniref:Uncharacterized protein n=1 Tax=Helobdella robusta TaxID=6412 RepID=T1EVA3_HELRO|nr:hypothetical protein HELRODRAFT_164339 [Helobdella robusta]ESN94485.1 hypothetical protein HELRODRAFT_164339 [Helobdella robusta]